MPSVKKLRSTKDSRSNLALGEGRMTLTSLRDAQETVFNKSNGFGSEEN